MLSVIEFPFAHSSWYSFEELHAFEERLLAARRADLHLDAQLRTNGLPWVKLRNEELWPAWHFCEHRGWPASTRFCIGARGSHVDIHLAAASETVALQVTMAGPIWDGEENWGADHRRHDELLIRKGQSSGFGPFVRLPDGSITNEARAKSTAERDPAYRKGLVDALIGKRHQSGVGCDLLVHAEGYHKALSREDFARIVAEAFETCPLNNFNLVHVQAVGEGYARTFPVR